MSIDLEIEISLRLLGEVARIYALRQKIEDSTLDVPWLPALRADSTSRLAHSSTAIEGNALTLPEVRALEEGRAVGYSMPIQRQEVLNCLAGLRYIAGRSEATRITESSILKLHAIMGKGVMQQGEAGTYRDFDVTAGRFRPPGHAAVPGLMKQFLAWWNGPARELDPVLSSAIIHIRLETIHPFGDGNGRLGRALAMWELYRRGFDTQHIFSVDEYFWRDRKTYMEAMAAVQTGEKGLASWLEYSAEAVRRTLEDVWQRIEAIRAEAAPAMRLILTVRQEKLLNLLQERGSAGPREIWAELSVSRGGAMKVIRPLLDAGIIEKVGNRKTGRYRLKA